MNIQYITDNKGKTTGVIIPIEEWEEIKAQILRQFDQEPEESSRDEILAGLKQAVEEMNLIKQGKLKARDVRDLLDEL